MFSIPRFQNHEVFEYGRPLDADGAVRRSNRRRLLIFLIVFLATLLPGLTWNLMRPAEYRASARVQIIAGSVVTRSEPVPGASSGPAASQPAVDDLLTQVQYLSSRSLLEEVRDRLLKEGYGSLFVGTDPLAMLQGAVSASAVAGTDIVEVQAVGSSPRLMAKIVNTLVVAYREQLFASHNSDSQTALVNTRQEVERLSSSIAEKRAQLAAFRAQSGVISSDRGENEALARAKGLTESLNKANEEAAKADARLRALRESEAAGKSQSYAKDNPTLAAIEQRISKNREELRDMERTYTPDFMAMDPTARALRARLAELEQQLAGSRISSRQAVLTTAEEDAASAHATVDRLRGQIDGQRREAQQFSGKFHDAQAMEEDLARIETARRSASERMVKLEASENARQPAVKLVEAAIAPEKAWRPDYLRDGLIILVAAFVLGLLAMWFVELFNRSPQVVPTTVVASPLWSAQGVANPHLAELPGAGGGQPMLQAPAAPALPRELGPAEVGALLTGASADARLFCTLLLLGLTLDEIRNLTRAHADLTALCLNVGGPVARVLPLPGWLARALQECGGDEPAAALVTGAGGQAAGEAEIRAGVTCAAIDAGLDEATLVSPEVLRHTFVAYLVRQGVRFSELPSLAGALSAEALTIYAATSSGPRHLRADEVDALMPALREFPSA